MSEKITSEMISRRTAISFVGLAAAFGFAVPAMMLTVSDAEAQTGVKDLTKGDTLPESKVAEVVQRVDPSDPLQHFNQPYYRHRRRVYRRAYRRGRRVVRRTYRRVRYY